MHIDIWFDFACPYCYIGDVRLKRVLYDLKAEQDVTVTMKSFELDPTTSREVTSTTPERISRKYGLNLAAAKAQIESISQLGRDEGIDFRYSTTAYSNTLDAHRLAKYGVEKGYSEIHGKLFSAYFTANLNLADHAVLARVADAAGLPAEEAREVLVSNRYEDAVRKDEADAAFLGIRSVPCFYIDKKTAINGVQPYGLMRQTFADLLQGRA